jgi:hypothetical protein
MSAFDDVPDLSNTFAMGSYTPDPGTSVWDQGGIGPAAGAAANAGSPSWLDRAANWLGSQQGGAAMQKLTGLLGTAGQADPRYLRIQAGAPPFSEGGANSLLNTLLQMQLQQQQMRQFPLGQSFRASLLG